MKMTVMTMGMVLLAAAVSAHGFFEGFDPCTFYPPAEMGQGSVTVDGDLSDWAGAQWVPMETTFNTSLGDPVDLSDCKYAARWQSNTLYVAVMCTDTEQHFVETPTAWNGQDAIELYIDAGFNRPTDYGGDMEEAQQYALGHQPDGGTWIVLGYGSVTIPTSPPVAVASTVDGDVISYEIAVPSWSEFPTTLKNLSVGDRLGLDVVVGSKTATGFAMLCNNDWIDKWKWADRMQDWKLVADPWGDVSMLEATGNVVGMNGWQTCYTSVWGVAESAIVGRLSGEAYEPTPWGSANAYADFAGAGRNIILDVTPEGAYVLTAAIKSRHHVYPNIDSKAIEIGDASILTGPSSTGNRLRFFIDDRPPVEDVYLDRIVDGATVSGYTDGKFPPALNNLVWWEVKIVIDPNGPINTASAYWRDLDDEFKQPVGGGNWTKIGDWDSPLPFSGPPVAMSFSLNEYASIDNIQSGSAVQRDPVDCAEANLAGYDLALDFNGDCRVDLIDLSMMAVDWVRCIDPADAACEKPWQ